jgi:hypothetical protein
VDIIIALGMAKEGFDWIWCEHALTVGYRSSLTEIIQIIGRATRDAPGKESATFTNLIAEPDASEAAVVDAINDTLKAIAASLLMEQVLAPALQLHAEGQRSAGGLRLWRRRLSGRQDQRRRETTSAASFTSRSRDSSSPRAPRRFASAGRPERGHHRVRPGQDRSGARHVRRRDGAPGAYPGPMGKIVRDRYPDLSSEDQEAVRQHAIAALNLTQKAKATRIGRQSGPSASRRQTPPCSMASGKLAMDVRELDIDLIDSINPFAGRLRGAGEIDERSDPETGPVGHLGQAHDAHPGGCEGPRHRAVPVQA